MEEYLENMKSLRSYMNDVEEEAAKRLAEEQRQRTAIDAMEADLILVKSQTKQVSDEAEQMVKEKTQLGLEIAEKQNKILALEVECSTLKQTLELLHQEIASSSAKLDEKRLFYTKTTENLSVKLQEQQEWLCSYKHKMTANEPSVYTTQSNQSFIEGEMDGMLNSDGSLEKMEIEVSGKQEELRNQLESAQHKMEDIEAKKSALCSEINKNKQLLEQEKQIIAGFPAALQQMDLKSLEEEHKALLCDKAGETEYFQSLEERINELKGVSGVVKCNCGLEYKVELRSEATGVS